MSSWRVFPQPIGHTDKSTVKYRFHEDKAGNSLAEPREGVDPDANIGKKVM